MSDSSWTRVPSVPATASDPSDPAGSSGSAGPSGSAGSSRAAGPSGQAGSARAAGPSGGPSGSPIGSDTSAGRDLTRGLLGSLDPLLRRWLPRQRWFAGKGLPIGRFELAEATELVPPGGRLGPLGLLHVLVDVEQPGRPPDCYQLLLGAHPLLPSALVPAALGRAVGGPYDGLTLYDAPQDPRLTALLLERLRLPGRTGRLVFTTEPTAEFPPGLTPRLSTAEQSNTSVVYGDAYILKLFRRVSPGTNPDLELSLALARAGSRRVAEPVAWFEADGAYRAVTGMAPATGPGTDPDTRARAGAGADPEAGTGPRTDTTAATDTRPNAEPGPHTAARSGTGTSTGPRTDTTAATEIRRNAEPGPRTAAGSGAGTDTGAGSRTAASARTDADDDPAEGTGPVTLGVLQRFLPGSADGWTLALASVAEDGDFRAEAAALGRATAEVHGSLAAALPVRRLDGGALERIAAAMTRRLEETAAEVPAVRRYAEALRSAFDDLAKLGAAARADGQVTAQRIHGDLHLGQALRGPDGEWVLIDFEGEPARPLAERRRPAPPVQDVAGMLRSFDYAAHHSGNGPWAARHRDAFCTGYAEVAGVDPREQPVLIRAFETDKAVYEARYEARHRPAWLPIPLSALSRLATSATR